MRKFVAAGVLGLAALTGWQVPAFSTPLMVPAMPAKVHAASGSESLPLVLVQSGDATMRVQQLEEELRSLNGRIEEMSFQLLQMQELIRKTQEDNEFRFQELEKGGGKKSGALERPADNGQDDVARIIDTPSDDSPADSGQAAGSNLGKPDATLGSIELDASGNPVGATINPDANNGSGPAPSAGQATASLGSENESYQAAYGHVLSGDYGIAEQEFRDYLAAYPGSAKAADANFWLGEAQYSQGKFNEAAKTFLDAHQAYSKSAKAPEMLLKLGMSLAALDNKDTACATLREVSKRYPKASRAVISKVASEQKRLAC
ncbi:tol-pal system protein YbgF [Rhizobiaceae bacterium n13]|uniref:Cell division coordinator CpoB n=1 Tax=Ferirhizobium litorale TaxID=2927786 RepID=A0AAE3TZ88_9HYPH|nr:tol-pal system protein YbgF [Fererhizobium litorale]MDI7860591.1 tol-pal system protein YbgF [Fererhizobium litorale]MDI7920739.1 tol-pal system protein YbgF [Fererhizobium litorale]